MSLGYNLRILREAMGLTQKNMSEILGVSKSNISKYEANNIETNLETLKRYAHYFNVPTDYLLGVGVFENWKVLLENKTMVLRQISIQAQQLAVNIGDGVDDITFAKLVYVFDIHITTNKEGKIGISGKDPIPTYTENYFSNTVDMNDDEKKILSLYRLSNDDDKRNIVDLLNSFCSLQERKSKTMVLGRCFELEEAESVAADKHEKTAK